MFTSRPRVVKKCPADPAFDPFDSDYLVDPYPLLAALRRSTPVFYAPAIDMYVVTRYDDIEAIFLDPPTFSAAIVQDPLTPLAGRAAQVFARDVHVERTQSNCDPPKHDRIRAHTAKAFSPRRMRLLEPMIRRRAEELVDEFADRRQADLIAELTFPLPASTIFTLIGFNSQDTDVLKSWCLDRLALVWGRPDADDQLRVVENMAAYWRYCQNFVKRRLAEPADDFTSDLLAAHRADASSITPDEVASIIFGLSFAGHETTTNLIGNGVRRLLEDRGRWKELRADPSLLDAAVEEILRFDTSVIAWRRITTRPVIVGGIPIPKGARLLLLLGSANRDESHFDQPERFDLHRANSRTHLSFGKGIHYCLGAALARSQSRVVLQVLVDRLPGLRLMPGHTTSFHPNIAFRGPTSLWVEWDEVSAG